MSRPAMTAAGAPPSVARAGRDARGFWRLLFALIAPVPMLAMAVENLIVPYPLAGEYEETLTGIASDPGSTAAALWLSLVFAFTLVPATIAVAWVARRGAPRLATAAGVVTLVGFAVGLVMPHSDRAAYIAVRKGLDPAKVVALNDAIWQHPALVISSVLFLLGLVVGLPLLGAALWRSRVAPAWMGIALMIAGPTHVLAPGNRGSAATLVLAAVGYASATVALLRMSNDDFDLPPLPLTTRS